MQNDQQAANPLERRIDMTVPMADIEKDVEQRLKKMAAHGEDPGFRPGKVPFKMVRSSMAPRRQRGIGEAVENARSATPCASRTCAWPAIRASRPKPGGEDVAARCEFTAVFEVFPEIRLGVCREGDVERPSLEIGEAEVDKTIEVLRKQRTEYLPVQGRAAAKPATASSSISRRPARTARRSRAARPRLVPWCSATGRMLPDFENGNRRA
jgi:trigger factor